VLTLRDAAKPPVHPHSGLLREVLSGAPESTLSTPAVAWNALKHSPMRHRQKSTLSLDRDGSSVDQGGTSHNLHRSVAPIFPALPSGVTTHGRLIHGGLCRTCCV
jgi:hypothetical protein